MASRIAWGAAHLLDRGTAPWLTSSERSRLRTRLREMPADHWQTCRRWLSTRQTTITRYVVADDDVALLLAEDGVVATGVSAAAGYQLALGTSGQADAYVTSEVARQLIAKFFLIPSAHGNLTLRVVDGDWQSATPVEQIGQVLARRLMVAIDLLCLGDARAITTGTDLLAQVLDGLARTRTRSVR